MTKRFTCVRLPSVNYLRYFEQILELRAIISIQFNLFIMKMLQLGRAHIASHMYYLSV